MIPRVVHLLSQLQLVFLPVLGAVLGRVLAELFRAPFPRACMMALGVGPVAVRVGVRGGDIVFRPALLDVLTAGAGVGSTPLVAALWAAGQAGLAGGLWWWADTRGSRGNGPREGRDREGNRPG